MELPIRLVSWNVNGLRAVLRKGDFERCIQKISPDIFCLQEIKCGDDLAAPEFFNYPYQYWNSAERPGYSGTAIFSKIKAISVQKDFEGENHPKEGRVITIEFPNIYVVCAYVPNAQSELARIDYRLRWDDDFRKHINKLIQKKAVVICGDLNCARNPIDLAHPKSNEKSAGYSPQERESFEKTLALGLIDTFRAKFPTKEKAYSWWSYRMKAREKNVGWRIDYWLASKNLETLFSTPEILNDIEGSDHCPVSLLLPKNLFS